MKTVGWIQMSSKKYGGIVYNDEAINALKKEFDVELVSYGSKLFKRARYLKILEILFSLKKLHGKKDVWIGDFYSTVATPFAQLGGKHFVIIHHDDFSGFPLISRPFFKVLQNIFYRNLKKADGVITVSEYWRRYFLEKRYKHVFKIYNAFDVSAFNVTDQEVKAFKEKYHLLGKPIIYLGNCQKAKGVIESYGALREIDAHLVTSGKRQITIPALHFDLNQREYLTLLKASSVVLTMSTFKEGWCRTAHEAMLLKVPVIGSGLGGMRELLEGGHQVISDFSKLEERVIFLLNNPEVRLTMGEHGYSFAKSFTKEKFNEAWIDLMRQVMSATK